MSEHQIDNLTDYCSVCRSVVCNTSRTNDLVEAVKARFDQEGVGGLADWIYELAIDTVEPIIRADEFTLAYEDVISRCRRDGNTKMALADLRAKVIALAEEMDSADPWWREHAQTFDAVLALFPKEKP